MSGQVQEPVPRAVLAGVPRWLAHELEAAKFFPRSSGGLLDPVAPSDTPSSDIVGMEPPANGHIASAGRCEPEVAVLNAPGGHWAKNKVVAGAVLYVRWVYQVPRKTRRFNYFLTREDWNPDAPLARDQFDEEPIAVFESDCKNHWDADSDKPFTQGGMMPRDADRHGIPLPATRTGYHVLLAVREIADSGTAFYQVIDLDLS